MEAQSTGNGSEGNENLLIGADLIMLPPRCGLFDNLSDSDSTVSQLSNPFSDQDLLPDHDLKKNKTESVADCESIYTLFSFSKDYTECMDSFKENTHLSKLTRVETMMSETLSEIRQGGQIKLHYKVPQHVQNKIVSMLNDKAYRFTPDSSRDGSDDETGGKKKKKGKKEAVVVDPKQNWEDLKDDILSVGIGKRSLMREVRRVTRKERVKPEPKKTKPEKKMLPVEDETLFETMSGYWRLISVFDEFKISPPGYKAFEEDHPHWLQTKPTPYHVFEQSREKCLEWLAKHFDKF